MLINTKLVVIAISGTLSTISLYRRNRKLRRGQATLVAVINGQNEYILYMADVLDRSDVEIPITEFDKIAINLIVENMKEGA